MFALVITVISIALVAVLALATLYYGGNAFGKGASRAEASKLLLQGQQLMGAADLYFTEHRQWPTQIQDLVTGGYLKQIPTAQASGLAEAVAAGTNWAMVPNTPTFYTPTRALDVCAEVNLAGSLKQKGILKHAYTKLVAQCYGSSSLTTVFKKATDTPLSDGQGGGIPDPDVIIGDPPTDPADPDWRTPPPLPPVVVVPPGASDFTCETWGGPFDAAGRGTNSNGDFLWPWIDDARVTASDFSQVTATIGGVPAYAFWIDAEDGYSDVVLVPQSPLTPGNQKVVITGATGKTAACFVQVVAGGSVGSGQLAWRTPTRDFGTFPSDYGGSIGQYLQLVNMGKTPVSYSNFLNNAPVGFNIDLSPGGTSQPCGPNGTLPPEGSCMIFGSWSPVTPPYMPHGAHNWTVSADSSQGPKAVMRLSLTYLGDLTLTPTVELPPTVRNVKTTVSVTNTSSNPVSLSSFTAADTSQFWTDLGTCGATLAPGASCNLNVEFWPTGIDTYSTHTVLTTSSGTFDVSLRGKGTCVGGDANWNQADGSCAQPHALNIDLSGGLCYDEYMKPPRNAMYASNYVRMFLPVDDSGWLDDLRAARGNYSIVKLGGPGNGPYSYQGHNSSNMYDYGNDAWWNGDYHNMAQSLTLNTNPAWHGIMFESYSDTPDQLGVKVGTSASDAMQFTFADPLGRYPTAIVTAYCDFSAAAVTRVDEDNSFRRVWGKAVVVGITGGYGYNGSDSTGAGVPVDYIQQAGNNLFEVPVSTPWSGSCTSSDAAQHNICAAEATRVGGGYASCQRWANEPSTMGPGTYRSRITCTR